MTITQIEVFIEVAKQGNFTRAGETLGMTQSAVSHSILSLEKHLGVKLINRSNGGLSLTQNGEAAYRRMLSIQLNINAIYKEMIPDIPLPASSLKIGSLPSTSVSILPKIIKAFNQKYPQVHITILEGTDCELLEWIETGTVDLGFTSVINNQIDSQFVIRDEMLAVVSTNHFLAHSKSISLNQLENESFIMSTGGCEPIINEIFQKHGTAPRISYRVGSVSTILEMVKEDIGISLIPKLALSSVTSDDLVFKSLKKRQYRNLFIGANSKIDENVVIAAFVSMSHAVVKSYKI